MWANRPYSTDLIGERRSIVGDEPGITRDRIYGEVDWCGVTFSLIDTGGMVPDDDAVIPANIFKQAGVAIEEAQVLVLGCRCTKGNYAARRGTCHTLAIHRKESADCC